MNFAFRCTSKLACICIQAHTQYRTCLRSGGLQLQGPLTRWLALLTFVCLIHTLQTRQPGMSIDLNMYALRVIILSININSCINFTVKSCHATYYASRVTSFTVQITLTTLMRAFLTVSVFTSVSVFTLTIPFRLHKTVSYSSAMGNDCMDVSKLGIRI